MRHGYRLVTGFFLACFVVSSPAAAPVTDPASFIGMPEEEAEALWEDGVDIPGPPPPSEGEIYYPSRGVTLGLYQRRVWQVRFDETTSFSWRGIRPGASRETVRQILGKPYHAADGWDLYLLPGGPWPLRLRIFYRAGEAFDFYLYRGDF